MFTSISVEVFGETLDRVVKAVKLAETDKDLDWSSQKHQLRNGRVSIKLNTNSLSLSFIYHDHFWETWLWSWTPIKIFRDIIFKISFIGHVCRLFEFFSWWLMNIFVERYLEIFWVFWEEEKKQKWDWTGAGVWLSFDCSGGSEVLVWSLSYLDLFALRMEQIMCSK